MVALCRLLLCYLVSPSRRRIRSMIQKMSLLHRHLNSQLLRKIQVRGTRGVLHALIEARLPLILSDFASYLFFFPCS